MTLGSLASYLCAGLLIVTGLVHSFLGEVRLIGPLLSLREGILKRDLARFLLRMVWHFMTILFIILALAVVADPLSANLTRRLLLAGIAVGIGTCGVVDAIGSRGRHVGWPLLVAIGGTAAVALYAA